ncbi:MAG: hypothetical protein KME32_26705 [Mojavia pulchra JT2-VF2]|jgi:hypothetical protein|uniref:Uncharacterized protein n=1 Tax=Mojavia pulchra JT2-VF2 TaxID=287848 RepID=A0A951UJS4_9NOST|nr:hypothetical protein [Mojavia pulchra JT2-VF2]
MAIPLLPGDARRTDSYAKATVEITDYHITEEIYPESRTLFYRTIGYKVAHENNDSLGLNAVNFQLALDEVFHVRS